MKSIILVLSFLCASSAFAIGKITETKIDGDRLILAGELEAPKDLEAGLKSGRYYAQACDYWTGERIRRHIEYFLRWSPARNGGQFCGANLPKRAADWAFVHEFTGSCYGVNQWGPDGSISVGTYVAVVTCPK